jgi:hypothetical protein
LLVLGAQIQRLTFVLLFCALLLSEFGSEGDREFEMGDPTITIAAPPKLTLLFLPCHHRCTGDLAIIGKQVYSQHVDLAINDKQAYFGLCL